MIRRKNVPRGTIRRRRALAPRWGVVNLFFNVFVYEPPSQAVNAIFRSEVALVYYLVTAITLSFGDNNPLRRGVT